MQLEVNIVKGIVQHVGRYIFIDISIYACSFSSDKYQSSD